MGFPPICQSRIPRITQLSYKLVTPFHKLTRALRLTLYQPYPYHLSRDKLLCPLTRTDSPGQAQLNGHTVPSQDGAADHAYHKGSGHTVVQVHTIEFLKQSLLHMHLLIWFDQDSKIRTFDACSTSPYTVHVI